ncbi:MAG: hypothetical protein ABSB15_15050 [Bryobacteraceae bacterium]|jgi:hypothetical protein
MANTTYICLFDLRAYDERIVPALGLYRDEYNPEGVVRLLRDVAGMLPELRREPERIPLGEEDYEHWIVALEPDAGYKPSEQTMKDVQEMLVPELCVPHGLGFNPMQNMEKLGPWLSERSKWFAGLEDGSEELEGGELEFTFGSDNLIASQQQIEKSLEEMRGIAPPAGPLSRDFENLRKLVEKAKSEPAYTLLRTSLSR